MNEQENNKESFETNQVLKVHEEIEIEYGPKKDCVTTDKMVLQQNEPKEHHFVVFQNVLEENETCEKRV